MLQIITGRFFTVDDLYRTPQQTVLYSNYRGIGRIDTVSGSYVPAGSSYDVATAVYAVEQRLEAKNPDGSKSIHVATSPEPLAQDFAALISFCLRVTCTLDAAVVARLTQSHRPPVGVDTHPAKMVPQVFDREVRLKKADESFLPAFVDDLVQLERVRYKAVMRAIRRYVVGLHRMGDDLALAYTLLVASIESLAQGFDEFDAKWPDLDLQKRERVDTALRGAGADTSEAVREAILEFEYVALGRRYREFALAHLPSSFFREEAINVDGPARAGDLPEALTCAYAFRSRLVHRLEDLPGALVHAPSGNDIVQVDGKPTLTFSGLARVARRVILRFVEQSPKIKAEEYDYRPELPGVLSMPMAPQYWIWRERGYNTRSAHRYLSGFLNELESVLNGRKEGLTNIRPILEKIELEVPRLALKNRLPMVALYLLFHRHISEECHLPSADEFLKTHLTIFESPSLESLVCHVVMGQRTGWDPEKQQEMRLSYLRQRYHKNGLKLGPILEAAMIIHTADAFLMHDERERVEVLISDVVENLPGNKVLLDLERRCLNGEQIGLDWRELLLSQSGSQDRSSEH